MTRPWPEAAAGALIGAVLAACLALINTFEPLLQSPTTTIAVLGVGALVGAVASWFIAMPSMRAMARAEERVAEVTEEALRRAA
jgi:hypothetical protein